jgi:putative nucleotidyltransferase with HDIG domain
MIEQSVCDSSPDRNALREQVRSTLARLSNTGELPTLPAAASAALAIARDPDADVEDLCRVIQTDIGLAARLMRSANSPAMGRRTPARQLTEAVLTLGLRQTCNLLVTTCARRLYRATLPGVEQLWNHALAVAVATETLASRMRSADPATVFLVGLFHDIGRVAFLMADASAPEVIASLARTSGTEPSDLEREWYGFDHSEAAAMLAQDWGLPPDQCDAIRWHHTPEQAGAARNLAALLNAADALAYAIGCGTESEQPVSVSLAPLGLAPEEETALIEQVRTAWSRQREVLS